MKMLAGALALCLCACSRPHYVTAPVVQPPALEPAFTIENAAVPDPPPPPEPPNRQVCLPLGLHAADLACNDYIRDTILSFESPEVRAGFCDAWREQTIKEGNLEHFLWVCEVVYSYAFDDCATNAATTGAFARCLRDARHLHALSQGKAK